MINEIKYFIQKIKDYIEVELYFANRTWINYTQTWLLLFTFVMTFICWILFSCYWYEIFI